MPSNQTTNYQLSQWVKSDQVRMEDFNADNAKIDAAIKAVDRKADGLAGSKADASALAALSQTVAGHTSTLSKLGNCQVRINSYTGNGYWGENHKMSFTFPQKPQLLVVFGARMMMFLVSGDAQGVIFTGSGWQLLNVAWSGSTVSWYSDSSGGGQMNNGGDTYKVLSFYSV